MTGHEFHKEKEQDSGYCGVWKFIFSLNWSLKCIFFAIVLHGTHLCPDNKHFLLFYTSLISALAIK